MMTSDVETSQAFNYVLSPHERCIRGDNSNNNKKTKNNNSNNNNVRNIHVAFEKNLNVFVRDHLDNVTVASGENVDESTKAVSEYSSNKSSVLKTEEPRLSSSSIGSDPDPNLPHPSQQDKNASRKETMPASSLVQIWEARTTSSNQNQTQTDSRTSSSGSNVLENSESLIEEPVKEYETIQPIQEGKKEEHKEEEIESDSQSVSGEKEREGVRVMDIIRKLSSDTETTTGNNDNGSSSNENGKEVQTTTTETRTFPQVSCSPRIRGRQAFADLLIQMMRDREKELASLLDRHCVSKFTHRGRIQSTLRIRCYERCIAIQDKYRSKSWAAGSDLNRAGGSDLNRSPRGSGVMHLLKEKNKTNSENISSSISSRSRVMDKDPQKSVEKKVFEETMEKIDVKEVQEVVSAKEAVLSELVENKNGLKKSIGETIKKEVAERRGEKRETKPIGETLQKETTEGRGDKGETKENDIAKENVQGNALVGIAEKVNRWNSEEKMNKSRWTEKGKANTERVDKKDVLEEATRRTNNVQSGGKSNTTCEFPEKEVRRKEKDDCVSVETKSIEIRDPQQATAQEEEKVVQETTTKSDLSETKNNKNGLKKHTERSEEVKEVEESLEGNTFMGIAEKVKMWNSKYKKSRRRYSMDRGKGKTGKPNTERNEVLQEASRRIINVKTEERSITTSKEKVVGTQEMKDKRETSREIKQCEPEEKERRMEEEELCSDKAKSKDITEVKIMSSQEVIIPAKESACHGSPERGKEQSSSPQDEETKKEECEEKREDVKEVAIEFANDWDEKEDDDDDDDYEDYGDFDDYIGEISTDWIYDVSRPRSYWEELRKERYLEVLNTESDKKDICNLIQSRTVSNFLTSDLRQKIDNLMTSLVQNHLGVPINQEEDEEEKEEWVEECSARNQEDIETEEEPEKTNLEAESDTILEADHDACSQSSERSSTLMISWSFRDQDIDKDHEPTTSLSLPEPSSATSQTTQEMQMISDLREQMEQLQLEMLELRNTVKSCTDMQLHLQKSSTQDSCRSGSSAEQRVETKNPLKRKCCVCSEMPVDSLLYRCGHMCTCLKCAHELQWSSKKCPICMAPIVDVVRAFLDA
ncbi:BnaCnng18700D [Brassica napus]|uniref:BnaCnng18700D protein n=1 Tax=Brassica napus TaxID=3708 RepID=A0A078IM18_BRANA|nr:BnaCnng18700D [Brassica napus]